MSTKMFTLRMCSKEQSEWSRFYHHVAGDRCVARPLILELCFMKNAEIPKSKSSFLRKRVASCSKYTHDEGKMKCALRFLSHLILINGCPSLRVT